MAEANRKKWLSVRQFRILHVEDDEIDAEAVRRGFRHASNRYEITRVGNGIDALKFLEETAIATKPIHTIILLDLKLPLMDGLEFLKVLRSHEQLGQTCVFLLSTSQDVRDCYRAYTLGIAAYIPKAKVGAGHIDLVQLVDDYVDVVELPDLPA